MTYFLLIACFFLSGAAGLVFEVVWVRHLTLALGHTSLAISVVLSAFMTGLALGSAYGGKKSDAYSDRRLLTAYIICEVGIGITGLMSLPLINLITKGLLRVGISSGPDLFKNITWFFGSFVPMIAPTVLMGATLPIMTRILYALKSTSKGSAIAMAYGANTLGAVCGALIAGFALIPRVGLDKSYLIAALCNFGAAAGAALLLKSFMKFKSPTSSINREIPWTNETRGLSLILILTGAAAMISQIAWTRLFSLVLGSSTFAFTIILVVFLVGLAGGSLLFRSLHRLVEPTLKNTAFLFSVLGLGILAYLPMFNKLPYYFSVLFQFTRNFQSLLFLHFVLCLLVMFLPTVLMGMILPWIIESKKGDQTLGSSVGYLYSANTIGAIMGSTLAGLVLIPLLGAETAVLIAAAIYLGLGVMVLILHKQIQVATVLAGVFIAGLVFRPPLDPAILSSGAFLYAPDYFRSGSYSQFLEDLHKNTILFHKDGLSSTVTVQETSWGVRFLRVNGKTDASSATDMSTQLLQAYLARLLHPGHPKKALLVGLGSGVTAGALASDINLSQIDCVEIEPAMKETLPFFKNINHNVAEEPRVRIISTDARHFLEATKETYDIITSEPSNPWIAGVSNLFTKEAFELSHDRLSEEGVFCQWFHSYSMGLADFKMVLKTFSTVFPHVLLFTTGEKDYFLLGSKQPWNIYYPNLERQFLENKTMREDLIAIGLGHPFSLLASTFLLDDTDVRAFCANSPLHLDDKPTLEFSAPRYLHRGEDRLILSSLLSSKKGFLPSGFSGLDTNNRGWNLLYNMLGEALLRSRQTTQAITAFEEAMKKNPSSARTWANKGRIHIIKGEHLQAEQAFKKAITLEPNYPLSYFHLGMLYLDQGLQDNGLKSLEKGLEIAPGDPMGTLQVAALYIQKNRKMEAEKLIRHALKRPIANQDLLNSLLQLLDSVQKKPTEEI